MTTYNYKCEECDYRYEVVQSMHDAPLVTCPMCEEDKLRRVMYPPTVKFIGEWVDCNRHASKGHHD